MESLEQIIEKQRPGKSLPKLLKEQLKNLELNTQGETFLSVYEGELTSSVITESIARIKAAFPSLKPEYFKILTDMLIENDFSDERLTDAVNHVIKNCVYPSPSIAQFLSFDKRVRLYTYHEMLSKVNEFGGDAKVWNYYEKKKINDVFYWVLKSDNL